MDEKLLSDLRSLKEKLRRKGSRTGRTPTICSDESLILLAKLAPKRLEDLKNIPGLGDVFVKKYGQAFMKILHEYHKNKETGVIIQDDVLATLKNLEQRLVNINKRNRLLYIGKLHNRYNFDLHNEELSSQKVIFDFLFGKKRTIELCNISPSSKNLTYNKATYKKIMPLIREVNKDARETGQYDLFVAYPFVIGKISGEDFNVHAPLALFPVDIIKDNNSISIKLNKSKDVLLNNNLIILHNKFNNINSSVENNILDDFDENSFLSSILEYYKKFGITINQELNELSPFDEYTADSFPKFENGEYHLCNNAVLGKFSLYSSALQRDFKGITTQGEINNILNNLLIGSDKIDMFSETPTEQITNLENFEEKNITYINDLDFSQENAVVNTELHKELVIQGPPGTGKSQTITSVITNAISKNKNVLMVSQKKAALDVIYSRLGNLSKYAIIISDVKNKNEFYEQMQNFSSDFLPTKFNKIHMDAISSNIDYNLSKLQEIGNALYEDDSFGTPMYKIYQENQLNSFHNQNVDIKTICFNVVNKELLNIDYARLKEVNLLFRNPNITNTALRHVSLRHDFPWLIDLRQNLDGFEQNDFKKMLEDFSVNQDVYLKQNSFKKLFGFLKRKLELKKIYKKYFENKSSFKYLYKNPSKCILEYSNYNDYTQTKIVYSDLQLDEKLYLQSLFNLSKKINEDSLNLNTILYDFIVKSFIETFEIKNRFLMPNISNFNHIVQNISSLMSQKKDLSKQQVASVLSSEYYDYVKLSKRAGEIQRAIESKRKPSVSKMINKFGFELFKGIKVWLMTPEVVSEILPLEQNLFDILVFDEASQLYIERAIPAIFRAKSIIIAGDHKQLRPSSLGFGRIDQNYEDYDDYEDEDYDLSNAALEEESLLDLARFKYPQVMLNYHYRARYLELINFSNYAFYKGNLNISPNVQNPDKPPIEVIKITNGLWQKRINRPEAQKTVYLIKEILLNRKNNETLGVITFNSNQRDLILDLLDDECQKDSQFNELYQKEYNRRNNGEDVGLFVKNIENVQGDERDIIIFSITYAKNEAGKVVHNFGWLNQTGGENRLNVAISRAKQKVYIVTSISPEDLSVDTLQNEGPKLFKKYLEYANAISNNKKELANQILLSFNHNSKTLDTSKLNTIISQLCEHLKSWGYYYELNVGVAQYKVDIAIKSPTLNKYLVGVECDNRLYTNMLSARERDIHRQKYLEARGWKTFRLWTTDWWHDKEKLLSNLKAFIEKASINQ